MNKEELKEQITNILDGDRDLQKELFEVYVWIKDDPVYKNHFFNAAGFTLTVMEDVGGEDQGREYYKVFQFTHKDGEEPVYIKFDGWYASHYGSEYERWFFVNPKQVTVTQYEMDKGN